MRWLVLLLIIIVPGGALIYGFGCWLLGQKPWDLWHEAEPDMYDGKVAYEDWVNAMHRGRAAQMKEEEEEGD